MQQWRSFLAREPVLIDEPDLSTVVREVGDFTMPVAHAANRWLSNAQAVEAGCWMETGLLTAAHQDRAREDDHFGWTRWPARQSR